MSNSPTKAAARAISDLTRYTAVPSEQVALDILQHLLDCTGGSGKHTYNTTLPFLFVYRSRGSAYHLDELTCSQQELQALRNYLPQPYLLPDQAPIEQMPIFDEPLLLTIRHSSLTFPSFKLSTITAKRDKGTILDVPIPTPGATPEAADPKPVESFLRVFLPLGLRQAKSLQRELSSVLAARMLLDASFDRVGSESRLSQSKSFHQLRSSRVLSETQSRFEFLAPALERLSSRLHSYEPFSTQGTTQPFYVTFLFRTKRRRQERAPRYRYIFTDTQCQFLNSIVLKDLTTASGNSLLEEVKAQTLCFEDSQGRIRRADSAWQEAALRWLRSAQDHTPFEIMDHGDYYGSKSFINYVSTSNCKSLYISDWRVWYPRAISFLDPAEFKAFTQWVATSSQAADLDLWGKGTEPLARLLRSAIEENTFKLRSMLLVAIPYEEEGEPIGVVQLSYPDALEPLVRIDMISQLALLTREVDTIIYADSLRDRLAKTEHLRHFISIAHTFTHAGQKLFSTPIVNAIRRLTAGIDSKALKGFDGLDRWALDDGEYSVELLEKHLGWLHRTSDLMRVNEEADWEGLRTTCEETLRTSFMRAVWDVVHDPLYRYLENALNSGMLRTSSVILFRFTLAEVPVCRIHNSFLQLHVGSLIENAVEALDLKEKIDLWQSGKPPSSIIEVNVQGFAREKQPWVKLECCSRTKLLGGEKEMLEELEQHFRGLETGEIEPFLEELRTQMDRRKYTTKSGGGHGWALLNAASYFRRLELWRRNAPVAFGLVRAAHWPTRENNDEVRISFEVPVPTSEEDSIKFLYSMR